MFQGAQLLGELHAELLHSLYKETMEGTLADYRVYDTLSSSSCKNVVTASICINVMVHYQIETRGTDGLVLH
jgi:hypothetical protein